MAPSRAKSNKPQVGFWTGPVPLRQFLDTFMPETLETRPIVSQKYFNAMPFGVTNDQELYQPFIDLLHGDAESGKPSLIPGLVAVKSYPILKDARKKLHTDLVLYNENVDLSKNVDQISRIELQILMTQESNSDPLHAKENERHLRDLAKYASQAAIRPHRPFSFMIYLGGPWVRFIRWELAGMIITERFNYRKNSKHLVDFLWRFAHMSDIERGWDEEIYRGLGYTFDESDFSPEVLHIHAHAPLTPISHFKSSRQFMSAMLDAFNAHKALLDQCQILHGDISPMNIRMMPDGSGTLTDWDMRVPDPQYLPKPAAGDPEVSPMT